MTSFSLTADERVRIERIDRLVILGATGVPALVEAMSDPSWTVRRATIAALAAAGDDAAPALVAWLTAVRTSEHAIAAAIDALVASIGSRTNAAVLPLLAFPSSAIATDGAQILGRRRAAESAPAIERLLEHDDDNVAIAAIDALGAIGAASSIEPLIRVLAQHRFFRTFAALQMLPTTGDPRVIAPLAALVTDETYRLDAIDALGRTGLALAIAPLAAALAGDDSLVRPIARAFADLLTRAEWRGAAAPVVSALRAAVGSSLGRFATALRDADTAERAAIATLLGRFGNASVLPALAGLLDDPALAATATEAIQQLGRAVDTAMLDALAASEGTRLAMLPMVSSARATPSVLALLADENPEVRARACDALARIGDTSISGALFDLLGDRNPRVAHAAAAAIQSLNNGETTPRTLAALASGTPAVRRQALRIVAYLGSRGAFEAVRAATDDPDRRIGELAVTALGAIEDPRVATALVELAASPHESLRASAMRAIGRRGDQIELLEAGIGDVAPWVRYYACQGLGRVGRGEGLLIARLADDAPHVRIAALEALAHLETPLAWQALCAAAGSPDPDVQRAGLVGLGLRARDGALPLLLAGAASPDDATRLIALSGLARRAESEAVAALAAAARTGPYEIATAALSLLGDRTDRGATAALVEIAVASPPEHAAHHAISRPACLDAIVARLDTADDLAVAALLAALARMRADAALVDALAFANPTVRRLAATTLVAIGVPDARERVAVLAATDPDPDVRAASAKAIE